MRAGAADLVGPTQPSARGGGNYVHDGTLQCEPVQWRWITTMIVFCISFTNHKDQAPVA